MPIFDSSNGNYVTTHYQFRANGTIQPSWTNKLKSLSDMSSNGESVNDRYRISDLSFEIIDTDGSEFVKFGNGTKFIGTTVELYAQFGGTGAFSPFAEGSKYVTTYGTLENKIFSGDITAISYASRILKVKVKSVMRSLEALKFRLPFYTYDCLDPDVHTFDRVRYNETGQHIIIGNSSFLSDSIGTKWRHLSDNCLYKSKSGSSMMLYAIGTEFDYGYAPNAKCDVDLGNTEPLNINWNPIGTGYLHNNLFNNDYYYSSLSGISTREFSSIDGMFPEIPTISLTATYLDTYYGVISTTEQARELGFNSLTEVNDLSSNDGTLKINKIKIMWGDNTPVQKFIPCGKLTIKDNYPNCIFTMLVGDCVSDQLKGFSKQYYENGVLYGDYGFPRTEMDLLKYVDSDSFADESPHTQLNELEITIDPKEMSVLPYLKQLIAMNNALFSCDSSNKFRIRSLKPFVDTDFDYSIGSNTLIDSEFSSEIEDFYNRFIVNYNYDVVKNEYRDTIDIKADNYDSSIERVLSLDAKYINSYAKANSTAYRLANRYKYSKPMSEYKLTLDHIGLEIGDTVKITDPDFQNVEKKIIINSIAKNLESSSVSISGEDAESMVYPKEFSRFSHRSNTVSGTSTSGWGTLGTVLNIDEKFGTIFRWW